MRVIGITGGVASGKSLVAGQLAQLGAEVLDGDRCGHEVLEQPEVRDALRARWGEAVFNAEGRVNRSAVAQIAFAPPPSGPPELQFLENLTHPRIKDMLWRQIEQMRCKNRPAAVLDAPVMFKAGWDALCDKILFVEVPREQRLARARQRGWTEQEFTRREAAQESLDMKRSRADVVIDNSGSVESTRQQVERFWRTLFPLSQDEP